MRETMSASNIKQHQKKKSSPLVQRISKVKQEAAKLFWHHHYPVCVWMYCQSNIKWNHSIPQAGNWQASWVWRYQERMVLNTALARSTEWLLLAPSAVSLKDHTSMLCLLGLLSTRSYSHNLRTSQKEVKLAGQLIRWIRLLWLGQVGLCLARD